MSDRLEPARLAEYLRALGHENRIRLLSMLRTPKAVHDIRLSPGSSRAGKSPDRPLARPSVLHHLDPLIQAGLVRVVAPDGRDDAALHEYVGDHARLFQLSEELRDLTLQARSDRAEAMETVAQEAAGTDAWEEGPKLVLVHGVQEGRVFPLRHTALHGPRGWVIGRRPQAHVRLEYDPFVSVENSEIVHDRGAFQLMDLRSARNGTRLNWKRLPVGATAPLESGDVVGVGRSLLVFREA